MPDTHTLSIRGSAPLLLCFSHLRWNLVFQRPQHLLTRAAQNFRVIHWEEPVTGEADCTASLTQVRDISGVEIVTPMLPAGLSESEADAAQHELLDGMLTARGVRPSMLWFYTPLAMGFAGHLRPEIIVYDCMDELSLFAGASPRLLLAERQLLGHADIVFTGGRSLHAAKRRLHGNVHCLPSAVDAAHFAPARRGLLAEPADQAGIPHPRIGYFGVLDERLDRELVEKLADLRPDWQFVMLGPIVKIAPEELPQRSNLHWLGAKPYSQLPAYLGGWDAGFMPFALNDATRFISPTKTPEFLAAGVPVVSTPVADVVRDWGRQGLVRIASYAAAMASRLNDAMAAPRRPFLAAVDDALRSISWDATWNAMRRELGCRAPIAGAPASPGRRGHSGYDWLVVGAGFAAGVPPRQIQKLATGEAAPAVIGANYYVTSERFLDHRTALFPPRLRGGNGRQTYADLEAVRAAVPRDELGWRPRVRELWARYRRPIVISEAHLGCEDDIEQARWFAEAWAAALALRDEGADIRAVTAWALAGAMDWDSLMRDRRDSFECGVWRQERDFPPRLLGRLLPDFARHAAATHPALSEAGWWRREDRIPARWRA